MKKSVKNNLHESRRVKPFVYITALLVNVLVFIFIGSVYTFSDRSYTKKLFEENVHSVESLNVASANAAYTYTNSMGVKINDVVNYIQAKGFTYDEAVSYLGNSNTNSDRQLQLVLSGTYGETGALSFGNYTGVSVRKLLTEDGSLETLVTPIEYGSGYYDIFSCFTDVEDEGFNGVCFASEFTDPDTKLKCFAVYRHITLTDAAGQSALYTVLLAVNSQTALDAYDMQSEFSEQSSVLVNDTGDYIIKSSEYRNVNFYDYIINYNGLTLDKRAEIRKTIIDGTTVPGSSVNLYYKNHRGADCIFSVTAIENGWFSIICVPLSSFSSGDGAVDYSLIILMLFLVLFILDGVAIYFLGKLMSYNVSVAEQATLLANEANSAKSRFLSTMSHELRTPLNAIIGLVSLAGDNIGNTSTLKDYLKKIDISSKLLLQLISDILDVSAIESNKMKLNMAEFDLTRLITSLSAIYYDQCAAKGIVFSVSLKNMHSELLVGDSVRVNQVLLNFLSNAVKFTPNGGRVTLCAEEVKRENEAVVMRFTVSDTGCGISDELKTRLFLPFERAQGEAARKHSGTGLGLSIAKNLAELMHGVVGLESTDGSGSSFWVEIPFSVPEEASRKSFSPIENMRVLAVISDPDERGYIGQMLTGFGMERGLAGSVKEALGLLRERSGSDKQFNLCILDWKLPDFNGLDAASKIREEFPDKSLRIMLLAYDIVKAGRGCEEVGADIVFGKPVFPSALYNVLEEISSDKVRTLPSPVRSFEMTGKRVLLVEDNTLNTEIAEQLLRKVGVTVEAEENGKLGYERFVSSKPGYFDAILMDVQMPVMDGYTATEKIRSSEHPQAKIIPILAMTADAFAEDVEKAQRAGMNEHISKPVVPDNLYEILKKYL